MKSQQNTQWAISSRRNASNSIQELIETCKFDNTLGDNGVIELITEIENKLESILLRWEKNNVLEL